MEIMHTQCPECHTHGSNPVIKTDPLYCYWTLEVPAGRYTGCSFQFDYRKRLRQCKRCGTSYWTLEISQPDFDTLRTVIDSTGKVQEELVELQEQNARLKEENTRVQQDNTRLQKDNERLRTIMREAADRLAEATTPPQQAGTDSKQEPASS